MDILKVDALAKRKNSKCHFLRDISKSFQEVTPMSPEPHQFFSFSNISTNMVARGIQSFGRNEIFWTSSRSTFTMSMPYFTSWRSYVSKRLALWEGIVVVENWKSELLQMCCASIWGRNKAISVRIFPLGWWKINQFLGTLMNLEFFGKENSLNTDP